ncbi:MAG: hypothetical protein GXO77_06420 [Calditrichaeota bacterium]|nr:hypothetical protein [Calditrichota bacterium]
MQISSKSLPLKSAEQAYQKISPGIQKIKSTPKTEKAADLSGFVKLKKSKAPSSQDILSAQERETLKMLFDQDSMFNFYGRSKVHQVRAGILLDVKG